MLEMWMGWMDGFRLNSPFIFAFSRNREMFRSYYFKQLKQLRTKRSVMENALTRQTRRHWHTRPGITYLLDARSRANCEWRWVRHREPREKILAKTEEAKKISILNFWHVLLAPLAQSTTINTMGWRRMTFSYFFSSLVFLHLRLFHFYYVLWPHLAHPLECLDVRVHSLIHAN